jgi:NAD(P)-dependent dehydrogenase (short-subunit alcohol dehydrogenase family)
VQGRVVIVTGGAKGIGRHAALTLAKAGAKVVLADADVERMHKTLGEIHQITDHGIAVPADVRDEKDVRHLMHKAMDRFGQIDALINDAGIVPHFNLGHSPLAARALPEQRLLGQRYPDEPRRNVPLH